MSNTYATLSDVADYLECEVSELPADTTRLIKRAGDLIDFATLNRVQYYPDVAKKATCAQVEYWIKGSESIASGAYKISSKRIGSVSVTYAEGASVQNPGIVVAVDDLAPRARMILQLAGLLDKDGVQWTTPNDAPFSAEDLTLW